MPPANSPHQNRLLAAFSPEDSERFFSNLHPVSLALRHVIQPVAAPLEYVYFIEQGVASVLTTMANGATVEVGMIGREGLVGVSALFGAEVSSQNVICQIPGTALRMNTTRCVDALDLFQKSFHRL